MKIMKKEYYKPELDIKLINIEDVMMESSPEDNDVNADEFFGGLK